MKVLPLVLLCLAACASPRPPLGPEDAHVLRPLSDPPDDVRRLVDRGDDFFVQAIGNPGAALDLYAKARASYLEAQTHYSGIVPAPLLDRVKACVTRIAALQREQHRTR